MRLPGPPNMQPGRTRVVEYVLVILTIAIIVVLATWFLGNEIAAGAHRPVEAYAMTAGHFR